MKFLYLQLKMYKLLPEFVALMSSMRMACVGVKLVRFSFPCTEQEVKYTRAHIHNIKFACTKYLS